MSAEQKAAWDLMQAIDTHCDHFSIMIIFVEWCSVAEPPGDDFFFARAGNDFVGWYFCFWTKSTKIIDNLKCEFGHVFTLRTPSKLFGKNLFFKLCTITTEADSRSRPKKAPQHMVWGTVKFWYKNIRWCERRGSVILCYLCIVNVSGFPTKIKTI